MSTKNKIEKENEDPTKVRFSGAQWFKAGPQNILIGGVGGIGSWLALCLGRIGHNLILFDGDNIEDVNLAGQFYKSSQVGQPKTSAVANNITEFANIRPMVFSWYDENSPSSNIVMSCFDNMAARKLMFEKWAANENREVFIDGRLLMEVGMVLCVQKGQEDEYRKQLFDDSEVEELVCNMKATTHAGMFIAALMTSNLNNYLANKTYSAEVGSEVEISTVQFKTEFQLPLLLMEELKE